MMNSVIPQAHTWWGDHYVIFYEIHKCNLIYFIQYISTGNKLSSEDKEVHSFGVDIDNDDDDDGKDKYDTSDSGMTFQLKLMWFLICLSGSLYLMWLKAFKSSTTLFQVRTS